MALVIHDLGFAALLGGAARVRPQSGLEASSLSRAPGRAVPGEPRREWLLYLLTLASGVLNTLQSGLTGSLETALDRPFLVAVVSLSGSLLCAVAGALVTGQLGWPAGKAAAAPWWAWLAGAAGFVVLIARPYAAPKLGAAPFTGLTVTASVVFSVLLDQYGLLGFEQHAAGWGRIIGAALMCAGVALVSLT